MTTSCISQARRRTESSDFRCGPIRRRLRCPGRGSRWRIRTRYQPDRISRGVPVFGDKAGILRDRLRDEQAIEGITVMPRQIHECQEMCRADVERSKSLALDSVRDLLQVGFQLSDANLHGDFPERCHTDEDVVAGISEEIPCPRRKSVIVTQPPKKRMRVQEEPHSSSRSMAASTSAGSVSKSGAIRNLPAQGARPPAGPLRNRRRTDLGKHRVMRHDQERRAQTGLA